MTRFGLATGGLAVGAVTSSGLGDVNEHESLMLSGHAVGKDRPAEIDGTRVVYRVSTAESAIALTFDDGPSAEYTEKVLDILDQHRIVATFNLIGEHAVRFPELAKRAAARHEIGNHTWSHPNMSLATASEARDQLRRGEDAIVAATGVRPVTFRPPYGYFSGASVMVAASFGYPMILWDEQISRARGVTVSQNVNHLGMATRPGSIILAHDGGDLPCDAVVAALPGAIERLSNRGFSFVTTSHLLALSSTDAPALHIG